MSASLIIPDNINDLSRWEQVLHFHRYGDTVLPLHPPGRGKNGKTPVVSKTVKRLSDYDLYRHFKNGATYNIGISPREGDIIINLDGKNKDAEYVDSFLAANLALAGVPRVKTAGGYHLRLHCDDLPSHVRQSGHIVQIDIVPGVNFELITGTHYVVAPPSLHEQKIPYRWVVTGEVPVWTWPQIATAFNLQGQEAAENHSPRDILGGVGALPELPMPDGRQTLNLAFTGNSPDIARQVFTRLVKEGIYFIQGGELVRYDSTSRSARLSPVAPDQLRSLLDKFFHFFKPARRGGEPVPATATKDDAMLLLAVDEMKDCLKYIGRVVKHPLLVSEGNEPRTLTTGAHDGIFVDSSDVVPEVPLSEAVLSILELFHDFKFNTPNDQSRAVAHLLSPALVFGNLIPDRVPMHVVQADHPGSGKGFMQKFILTIYNETPGIITNITKGPGGIDEILSSRLMSGFARIQYDNWRGKLVSEMLESALTEDAASCRKLHAEAIVSTKGAFFMLTSNGAELTPDLADRSSFIRIAKQPDGYRWRKYNGEELSQHIKNHRVHYLGCIYAVLSEWIRQGKPQIEGAPHRFWQWAGSMDWIVQKLFSLPPLLDGHRQVQKEVASDILTFLRQVAIKVEQEGQLGEEFIASALVELAQRHHVTIPGIKDATDENAHKSLGRQMGRCFRDGDTLALDSSFQIVRKATSVKREDGNGYNPGKAYVFFRTTADPGSSSCPFNSGNPSDGQKPGPASPCGGEEQATTAEPLLNEKYGINSGHSTSSPPGGYGG